METCQNCHTAIGDLETPCVWNGAVVCPACHTRLQDAARTHYRDPSTVTSRYRPHAVDRSDISQGVALGIGKVIAVIILVLIIVMIVGAILSKLNS